MRAYILSFLFLGGILLFFFRVSLQILMFVILIKYRKEYQNMGIDRWLVLVPELTPLKRMRKEIQVEDEEKKEKLLFILRVMTAYKIYALGYIGFFIFGIIV